MGGNFGALTLPDAQKVQPNFRLYLITDRKVAAPRDLVDVCRSVLSTVAEAGLSSNLAIQLREKDLLGGELYKLACRLNELCQRFGAPLLINERLDIAVAVEAAGVHLPAESFPVARVREVLGKGKLIGVSTHSLDEVVSAYRNGADFVVFGPVYSPLSKGRYSQAKGVEALSDVTRSVPIPVFALGGITAERVRELSGCGAAGVAVIGAVMGAESPAQATLQLLDALSRWETQPYRQRLD